MIAVVWFFFLFDFIFLKLANMFKIIGIGSGTFSWFWNSLKSCVAESGINHSGFSTLILIISCTFSPCRCRALPRQRWPPDTWAGRRWACSWNSTSCRRGNRPHHGPSVQRPSIMKTWRRLFPSSGKKGQQLNKKFTRHLENNFFFYTSATNPKIWREKNFTTFELQYSIKVIP